MKSVNDGLANQLFGGVFSVIADSLGQNRRFLPAATGFCATVTPPAPASAAPGVAARIGQWFLRRQMGGIGPVLARSQDVFDRLDQWMWRQQSRDVESYLAKSSDVFDLERRIKALERGPGARVF
jgi:hypothetical protein